MFFSVFFFNPLYVICQPSFVANNLPFVNKSSFDATSPKYEFRAVWVATVTNIDWPSKKGLSSDEQKAEFIHLLDAQQRNGMNAVIVQIRPAADAFYSSPYEPWSEYLSGIQGIPPSPYYDPLKFMIEETHKRGMEFHAWLNPYRAVFNIQTSSVSPTHITRTHPEWFLAYGNTKFFNPGEPAVMQYVANIVKDIVSRYDVDAIHMDDYFYPYRIAGKEFPDNKTYIKYGNGMNKDDWRRSNCDSIIKHIHETIINTNPMVKFGISPFGVWRNKSSDANGSDTKAGQTNYDDLYANILLWLKNGWIDYVAPQLYWEIGNRLCDYKTLLNWWASHSYGKHVYIGHGIYRTEENPTAAWRNPNELPDEIQLLRKNPNIEGSVFFSSTNLLDNPNGWEDSLQNDYYKYPALIPPMPWIDTTSPQAPSIINIRQQGSFTNAFYIIDCKESASKETETVKNYVLYLSNNFTTLGSKPYAISVADSSKNFSFNILPSQIPSGWSNCYVAVTCVDKENNESAVSNVVQFIITNKGWMLPKN